MKRIQIIGLCMAAVFAFSAIAAASAFAEPEFVAKAGQTFPKHFTSRGGSAQLATVGGSEIECTSTLDLGRILPVPSTTKSMLGDIKFTFHKCSIVKGVGSGTECNSTGEPKGLITTPLYVFHLGKLKELTAGKKHVLILLLVTNTKFSCGIIGVTVEGNLVGVFPEENAAKEKQFNEFRNSVEVVFKGAAGKQEFKEFEFTLPPETKTGLTLMSNAGLGFEEASENASGTETLEGGETVELKG
jgi:hypothetical protein